MLDVSGIIKKLAYAAVFGLTGLIVGIWTADLFYGLIVKNIGRVATIYVSLIIIILITVAASLVGFAKGKNLLD